MAGQRLPPAGRPVSRCRASGARRACRAVPAERRAR